MHHCFEASQVTISVNVEPLEPAADFLYLVCTVELNTINWADLYQNPQKEWRRWGVVAKALTSTGEMVRSWEMIY